MINRAHLQWNVYGKREAKEKIRSLNFSGSGLLLSEHLWFHLTAFFFGMASINGLYPFGLSYLAAAMLHRKKSIAAGLFSFTGILVAMKNLAALRYLGAMVLFVTAFNILKSKAMHRELTAGLIVFISNSLAGLLYLSIAGMSPYDLLLLGMESALASIATFIIPGGLSWFFKIPVREAEKSICLAILAGVGLSIARNFEIYNINVKTVASVIAVLVMALIGGPGAGTTTGIIIGVTGSSFAMSPWFVTILAFSGLVAGTFNKMGKPGTVAGFVLGYVLYNLYVNSMGESLIPWPVLAVSCSILLMMPAGLLKKLEMYLNEMAAQNQKDKTDIIRIAGDRLLETATLLEELGKAFAEPIVESGGTCRGGYLDNICREVQQKVCLSCGLYKTCWERELNRTVKSFYELIKSCEADRPAALPHLFRIRCGRIDDIKRIINELSLVYNLERHMHNIAERGREKIRASFQGASGLVKQLVKAIQEDYLDMPDESRIAGLGVAVGVVGAAKEGFDVSGDDFCFSELKNGRYLLALSDGMGVGEKAAKCSRRTLDLLERFLDAGFDYNAALGIVNSAMAASSSDDRFSTVDMAVIDTCTGMTDFIKAGSAASFVKRGSRVETIMGGSLPVGIMDEVNPKVIRRDLKSGDILILVTDGVIDALSGCQDGEEQLKKLLCDVRTTNPQEIAEDILKKARLGGNARDDMTVLVARLWD